MLSRLTNISKFLALTAAVLLILISVHGIFLHHDQPGEQHTCTLCEINTYSYTFPDTCEFVAEVAVPVISHICRETDIFLKTPHRFSLRGPPARIYMRLFLVDSD